MCPHRSSAKLRLMKERMTATPRVAFDARSDSRIKAFPRGSPLRVKIYSLSEVGTDKEDRD